MNRLTIFLAMIPVGVLASACGDSAVEEQSAAADPSAEASTPLVVVAPDEKYNVTGKPAGPVKISYRIIGTPVVGQPVTIDLKVESNVEDMPVTLSYGANDSTALTFPESQLQSVALAFAEEERESAQQVTITPMREGRLFLNVSAEMLTENGSLQTVTAIPIQVGGAPRKLEENGVVTTDENDELIRDMPASEN
ncbi:MAG: hypothetical protein ACR2QX_09750 [Woeseiaceae bacterium]